MQSDWLEPVLCQIDKYERKYDWMEEYEKSNEENDSLKKISVEKELLNCIMNNELYRKNDRVDIKKLKDKVIHSKLETPVKCDFWNMFLPKNQTCLNHYKNYFLTFYMQKKQ